MSDTPAFTTTTAVVDRLIAGNQQLEPDTETLITGQNLPRGALLGKITTGGKLNLSLSGAADGSEVPYAVLAHATDATAADNNSTPIYLAGRFNENAMTFGAGHTAASVKDGLRDKSIYLTTPQKTG